MSAAVCCVEQGCAHHVWWSDCLSLFPQYSGLVNGTSYSVSVWVRVPAMLETQVVGMMLVLGTYGLPYAPLSPQAVTFTNADAWQWKQLTWSGVAPISGRVMLRIHGVGAVWMDNWEVYQN